MPKQILNCNFIVLRKTIYSNSSLIIAGISPENGQQHFIIKGGRKLNNKKYPAIDLFRHIKIYYQRGKGELLNMNNAELINDYSSIAQNYHNFQIASWLSTFTLKNIAKELAHPLYFQAINNSLALLATASLSKNKSIIPALKAQLSCILFFLQEEGLLASFTHDQQAQQQCNHLFKATLREIPYPQLSETSWYNLKNWAFSLLQQVDCHIPPQL